MLSEPWIATQQDAFIHSFEELTSFVIQMSKAWFFAISSSTVHQDHVRKEGDASLSLIHWTHSNLASGLDVRHRQSEGDARTFLPTDAEQRNSCCLDNQNKWNISHPRIEGIVFDSEIRESLL